MRFRLVPFIFLLAIFQNGCRQEVHSCTLRSTSGAEVVISIVISDDSPVDYVEGRVADSQKRLVAQRILLGLTQGPIRCGDLGLYEADSGRILGLFERESASLIILVADIERRFAFASAAGVTDREISEYVARLSSAAERCLEFGGGFDFSSKSFLNWTSSFPQSKGGCQVLNVLSAESAEGLELQKGK